MNALASAKKFRGAYGEQKWKIVSHFSTPFELLLIQIASVIFASDGMPAIAIFLVHFPVLKRFRYISFIYSISRALMHIITSFGIVYLVDLCGLLGLWIVLIPTNLAFLWGIFHFQKLEKS